MIYVFPVDNYDEARQFPEMDVKLADGMLVGVLY